VRSEKDVVTNERAMRVDDDVEGSANEVLYQNAFRRHPYHWPTIGWREDIASFTTEDCRAFYRTYYAPNNAVIVIAGDVDEREALRLVQRHYGALRPAVLPEEPRVIEPPQRAERRVTIRRPTPTDKLQIGYRAPAFGDFDHAVLVVLNEVLFGGRSSRLYRALVSEGELAAEVRGSVAPFRDPGLYEVWVSAREGHDAEALERVLDAELARVRASGITAAELEKAKNRLELAFLQGMETASGKAEQIGFYAAVLRDPGRVFARLEDYRRVTRDDVRRVAGAVLDPRRRTVVVVRPDGSAPAEDAGGGAEEDAE
jgi:zinc protease